MTHLTEQEARTRLLETVANPDEKYEIWWSAQVSSRVIIPVDVAAILREDPHRQALEEVATGLYAALKDGDWAALINHAKVYGIAVEFTNGTPVDRWDEPAEYEFQGDHEEDARYTFPACFRLMEAVLKALLDDLKAVQSTAVSTEEARS